ncbi:MAG TPA: ABC transporter substrate-binding protein [Chloroflexia bacterium]|nr:ABC transporter substrate-binding protein [Chloroflexia bacterium]
MEKIRRSTLPLLAILMLMLSVVLAACGDNTATPAVEKTAAPVATAPASIPTAALNSGTTAAAMTPATTTAVATTAVAATTSAATTAAATSGGTPKKGGSVTLVSTQDAKTLHPYNCTDVYCVAYIARIYGGFANGGGFLVTRNPKTLEVVPLFAKSWTVDQAAMTVTYTLKDDLKWSDGSPMTSDDFLWTYQQAIKKENNWVRYGTAIADKSNPNSPGVIDYQAPDPKTIKVFLHTLTFDIVERGDIITPLPRKVWEGKDWSDPTKNPAIDNPTVTSGPWKLKAWDKGKSWTVVRNDLSTAMQPPLLDQMTVVTVDNASIGFQKIKSGEADAFENMMGFSAQDEAEAEKLPNATVYKWTPANASWEEIAFNFRRPYLQDVNLRTAMNWVIDRKAIIDKVYYGLAVPMYSDVPPSSDKFDETAVQKYTYDPAKAKQILQSAGYTLKDGKLYDPKGNAIPKLKMVYPSNFPEPTKIAQIAQQEWKDLGLDVDLIAQDFNTVLKTIQQEPFDFDTLVLGWSASINPETFGSVWTTIPSLNFGNWVNKDVNDLYASALKEFDNAKRKEFMSKIQSIESRDGPYIYVIANIEFAVVNNRIGGVVPTTLGIGINNVAYSYATDWYIK